MSDVPWYTIDRIFEKLYHLESALDRLTDRVAGLESELDDLKSDVREVGSRS